MMIELYYGDGKGKTSAAIGLAVRAAGHHVPVLFVQFLKDGSSGELKILKKIDEVEILTEDGLKGFFPNMDDDEKKKAKDEAEKIFESAKNFAIKEKKSPGTKIFTKPENDAEIKKLLVLDEVLHAVHFGLIDEKDLLDFLKDLPKDVEVVLTGRAPSQQIINVSDYATEFRKEKHPFDRGVMARTGVEM